MTADNFHQNKKITYRDLLWDTAFFGLSCLKVILHEPLSISEWAEVENRIKSYDFVTIENQHSEPENARLIGQKTSAFLADTNIQFQKQVKFVNELHPSIRICNPMERDDRLLDIGDFRYSRFFEDKQLASRGGKEVYKQWLLNAFNKEDKYFAVSEHNNLPCGYVLFSFTENVCIIELIAVSEQFSGQGIGAALFNAVEFEACRKGAGIIQVGTQVRNLRAINFYHKMGCKHVGSHQIYHLHQVKRKGMEDKA
ncbi:GNAT family N-acetyltransferase [Thermoclostridium caenicola]|uniref:Ribosomal protein S18 acetylase RimI n=1 Tax=Thermoclostridium caenicola TaxID=659425 RepID=A0A1M6J2V9_9FIRM|nr:GNAT family N-acetyltransferase [Thermoclostridium caenicola]SHJ40999.1 Ribosomal protein S18 acetylase RimI [Thermoclostridium caenicola]